MKKVNPFLMSQGSIQSNKENESMKFTPEKSYRSSCSLKMRGKSSQREKYLQTKIDKILQEQGEKIHEVLTSRTNKHEKNKISFRGKEGKKLFFDLDEDRIQGRGEDKIEDRIAGRIERTEKSLLQYSSKYSENQMKYSNKDDQDDEKSINFSNYRFKEPKNSQNKNSMNNLTIRNYLKLTPSEFSSKKPLQYPCQYPNQEQKQIIQQIRELKSMIKTYFEEDNHQKRVPTKNTKNAFTSP